MGSAAAIRSDCLVVSVPGADERGASVFERVLDHANAELATMVDQAAITAEEDDGWRSTFGRGVRPISSRHSLTADAFGL